ncbi:Tetratricopeptide repeat protein [Pseudobythopirellula maris]|uniref:Tetratricopeptide repeat protein n=1 Tax=Pseudobythopirellula maris TaxID=2527991 RepID=A0A5C5ZRQ3_9BACT|nr:tetratricopeptide repeat protein [Pseudobythopirellula maris]TWT90222.1 Tetratricopeptide repeat protein [Pseudobythopirellula maris]
MASKERKNDLLKDLHQSGRYGELADLCRKRVEKLRAMYGPRHGKVGFALKQLAYTHYLQGDLPRSEESLRAAIEVLGDSGSSKTGLYRACQLDLARVCIFIGKHAETESLLGEVLSAAAALPSASQRLCAGAHFVRSKLQRKEKDFEGAEQSLEMAEIWILQQLGEESRYYASLQHQKGEVYWRQGRFSEAEHALRKSMSAHETILETESADYAMAMSLLGEVLAKRGNREEASESQGRALEILKRVRPAGHSNILQVERLVAEPS